MGSEPVGPVVFEVDEHLSDEQRAHLRAELERGFAGQRVVVLPPGVRKCRCDQLDRIEHQLDALVAALADEGDEEQDTPATSLDGELVPGDRDQSQSLG